MPKVISEVISQEVLNFKNRPVMLTEGYNFSQFHTIRRINKYIGDKFWDCPDPNALFWNLPNQRIPLYGKSVDMNTKDFVVTGIGDTNYYQAWILNVRFKQWAKEDRLALTLDDVSNSIATYGTSVWKKIYKDNGEVGIEEVDIRNLYLDPTVKNIIDSPVIEMHYLTESEIRSKYPDKVDEVIERADQARDSEDNTAETEDDKYEVWERWGEYKPEEYEDAKYMHFIGVGAGDKEVILAEDEIPVKNGKPTEFPYYDFHGERVKGRWLGLGIPERLFGLQEQMNTLVNQNAESNAIASLLLLRTADPNTNGNMLQSAVSGQIINSQDMQQIGIDNRFIQTFLAQLERIERKADELCYINESISGETPPSGIPFRSLAVSARAAKSTFSYLKTAIGEKMGFILQEQILPSLVKGFNKEDIIEMSEDEMDIRMFDEKMLDLVVQDYMIERAKDGKVAFEEDIIQRITQAKKDLERNRRIEKIGKNFFDFKYGIKMNPTGESVDKNVQNAAIDSALEYMIAQPAVVNTPLFKQKLSNNNIPPFRLTPQEQAELQQPQNKQAPEAPKEDKLLQMADEE